MRQREIDVHAVRVHPAVAVGQSSQQQMQALIQLRMQRMVNMLASRRARRRERAVGSTLMSGNGPNAASTGGRAAPAGAG
jgi:hypothetical protein